MKTIKNLQIVILLAGLFVIHSCVENGDFDIPDVTSSEPAEITATNVMSASAVAGFYIQELNDENDPFDDSITVSFENSDKFMEGYVISSDRSGNFFEEIIVQDKLENPTFGIKVLIDVNPLYTSYEVGRKIYVRLQGLSIGIDNGVLTLGVLSGTSIEKIPAPLQNTQILRSSQVGTLVAKTLDLSQLTDRNTNQYVTISNAQFNRNDVVRNELTYAAEPGDQFDGERTLESCDGGSIIFSTSTFSDFKGLKLPAGRGTITGILNKNFFGDEYNFVINSPSDIDFSSERCDPNFLECTDPINGASTTTIFSEDFESFGSFASEGWTNLNISGGSTDWVEGNFGGNSYAQISGFNAGAAAIDVWLVTPSINLDATTEEVLNFDVQTNFNNGEILTVWVSTDFTGDPTTATWQLLDLSIPSGSSSGFGSFEPVNTANLSCLSGDIHIGFFYQGADPGPTTRYHIDNIEVSGK